MKNFRKVLALILVVATLFSFVAMVSAKDADDYSDYDKVSYAEAVDVLSAIGILDGYPDGTFRPTNTIKRSEMAKMIAVLSNAGDDVSDLYASACTFADAKNDWAASYIAYCAQTGIVSGRNATTFDPNGKVTGIETAKMLLCLIGFDAVAQGYVGVNWKTNILSDAKNIGLLEGFAADYDIAKAITREEAAQMMLNALKAPMVVGTVSNNIVTVTNNVWIGAVYGDLHVGFDMTLTDAAKDYGCWVLYGNVVVSPIPVYTNYRGLSVSDVSQDCYGNPVTEWVYENAKGVKVWSAQYAATPDYSATVKVDFDTVLADEIDSTKHTYSYEVYVDGFKRYSGADVDINWSTIENDTGKGVLTNVFVDDVEHEVIITIKNTFIARVESVTYGSSKFTLNDVAYTTAQGLTNRFDNTDYGFETGDIILYWVCSNSATYSGARKLHDAKVVSPVVTDVSRVTYKQPAYASTTATAVSSDGKSYEYAKNLFNSIGMLDAAQLGGQIITEVTGSDKVGGGDYNTYDLYLDEYGYIMAWQETTDEVNDAVAYYVPNSLKGTIVQDTANGVEWVYTIEVVTMDAQPETLTLAATSAADPDVNRLKAVDNGSRDDYGALMTYVTDKDGKVTLQAIAGQLNNGQAPAYFGSTTGTNWYVSKEGDLVKKGTTNDSVWMSGNSSTKYLVKTGDTYTAYNYWELPGDLYSSDEGFFGVNPDNDQSYAIQYFYTNVTANNQTGSLLSYVFIDAKYTLENTIAFVGGYKGTVSDIEFADDLLLKNYIYFDAIIEGAQAYLAVDYSYASQINLDTEFVVVNANLKYIGVVDSGLVDGTVPVYTLVNYETAELHPNGAILVSDDFTTISVTDGTSNNVYRTYKLADDCTIAVGKATYEDDAVWKNPKIELIDAETLADYVSDFGEVDGLTQYRYKLDHAWFYLDDNGQVSDLFISTNRANSEW